MSLRFLVFLLPTTLLKKGWKFGVTIKFESFNIVAIFFDEKI